jgi:hypothetical protein
MRFLALVVPLSALTGLAWFVSLIMPDVLGPLLYLSVYLLVFAGETVSRGERSVLWLIAWWGVASHASHLILAAGLCIVVALALTIQHVPRRSGVRAVDGVASIIVLAAAAHLALNSYLYGEPSLKWEEATFSDGPCDCRWSGTLVLAAQLW